MIKILRIPRRLLQKGPYDSRFEGLREGARDHKVVYNNCNLVKKSVETLIEEGSWKSIKLTSFDAGLPDDVLDSSLRNRIKCCKRLTLELWIVTSRQRSRTSIQTVADYIYFVGKEARKGLWKMKRRDCGQKR